MTTISEIQVLKEGGTKINQIKIIFVEPLPPPLPADTSKEELSKLWNQLCYSDAVAIKTELIDLLPLETQKILTELLSKKPVLKPPKINHKKVAIGLGITITALVMAALNLHPLWTVGWIIIAIVGTNAWLTGEWDYFPL